MSSPREREKRDKRDSGRDDREGQGRKMNRNESVETKEINTFPHLLLPATRIARLALNCKTISVGRLGDVRYATPLHTLPPHHPSALGEKTVINIRQYHPICIV